MLFCQPIREFMERKCILINDSWHLIFIEVSRRTGIEFVGWIELDCKQHFFNLLWYRYNKRKNSKISIHDGSSSFHVSTLTGPLNSQNRHLRANQTGWPLLDINKHTINYNLSTLIRWKSENISMTLYVFHTF